MEKEKAVLHRAIDMQAQEGNNSFAALLQQNGDEFRRDVFLALFPEHTALGRIQAGITTLYPRCSGRPLVHDDVEEVYYFTRGSGIMTVDGIDYDVSTGDTLYIQPGPSHFIRNSTDFCLEYFWITVKI